MNTSQTGLDHLYCWRRRERDLRYGQSGADTCPFSCPHSQQPGSNEADSHWNSHSVPLQQITESGTRAGGMSRTSRFLTSRHLASLSLNLRSLCTFFLAVLSPGSMGKHDSLDGLLCLLLRHLAHPPHRPRHAGPGKSNVSLSRRQWG